MNRVKSRTKRHKEVEAYILKLRKASPESKKEAREALIRTGVLTRNGNKKDTIVSWE